MIFLWSLFLSFGFSAADFSQEPTQCYIQHTTPCFVKAKRDPLTLEWKGAQIHLSRESMVQLQASGLKLLRGHLWIESSDDFVFETSLVQGLTKGSLWIEQSEQTTIVKNLSADFFMRNKLSHKEEDLLKGFENWFTLPQSGEANPTSGVPRPMSKTENLALFKRLFHPSLHSFEKAKQEWQKEWMDSVEEASRGYAKSIGRHLASVQERTNNLKRKRAQEQEERLRLRQHFRSSHGFAAETSDEKPEAESQNESDN